MLELFLTNDGNMYKKYNVCVLSDCKLCVCVRACVCACVRVCVSGWMGIGG